MFPKKFPSQPKKPKSSFFLPSLDEEVNFFSSGNDEEKKPEINNILFLGTNETMLQTLNNTFEISKPVSIKNVPFQLSFYPSIDDAPRFAQLARDAASIIALCPKDADEHKKIKKFLVPIDEEMAQKPSFDLTPLLITATPSDKIFLLNEMPTEKMEKYKNSFIIVQPDKNDFITATYYINSNLEIQYLDCNQQEHPAFYSIYTSIKKNILKLSDNGIDTEALSLQKLADNNWKEKEFINEKKLFEKFLEEIKAIVKQTNISSIFQHCEKLLPEKLFSTEAKKLNPSFGKQKY